MIFCLAVGWQRGHLTKSTQIVPRPRSERVQEFRFNYTQRSTKFNRVQPPLTYYYIRGGWTRLRADTFSIVLYSTYFSLQVDGWGLYV